MFGKGCADGPEEGGGCNGDGNGGGNGAAALTLFDQQFDQFLDNSMKGIKIFACPCCYEMERRKRIRLICGWVEGEGVGGDDDDGGGDDDDEDEDNDDDSDDEDNDSDDDSDDSDAFDFSSNSNNGPRASVSGSAPAPDFSREGFSQYFKKERAALKLDPLSILKGSYSPDDSFGDTNPFIDSSQYCFTTQKDVKNHMADVHGIELSEKTHKVGEILKRYEVRESLKQEFLSNFKRAKHDTFKHNEEKAMIHYWNEASENGVGTRKQEYIFLASEIQKVAGAASRSRSVPGAAAAAPSAEVARLFSDIADPHCTTATEDDGEAVIDNDDDAKVDQLDNVRKSDKGRRVRIWNDVDENECSDGVVTRVNVVDRWLRVKYDDDDEDDERLYIDDQGQPGKIDLIEFLDDEDMYADPFQDNDADEREREEAAKLAMRFRMQSSEAFGLNEWEELSDGDDDAYGEGGNGGNVYYSVDDDEDLFYNDIDDDDDNDDDDDGDEVELVVQKKGSKYRVGGGFDDSDSEEDALFNGDDGDDNVEELGLTVTINQSNLPSSLLQKIEKKKLDAARIRREKLENGSASEFLQRQVANAKATPDKTRLVSLASSPSLTITSPNPSPRLSVTTPAFSKSNKKRKAIESDSDDDYDANNVVGTMMEYLKKEKKGKGMIQVTKDLSSTTVWRHHVQILKLTTLGVDIAPSDFDENDIKWTSETIPIEDFPRRIIHPTNELYIKYGGEGNGGGRDDGSVDNGWG